MDAAAYINEPVRSAVLIPSVINPYVAETPGPMINHDFLTPETLFFVWNHGPVPKIDPLYWSLKVEGECYNPREYDLDKLNWHYTEIVATLSCALNRSRDYDNHSPITGPVMGPGAIGNARWGGIPLKYILDDVLPWDIDDLHVEFIGADVVDATKKNYIVSLPLHDIENKHVLLAWNMNGQPLTQDHGFPLWVIAPGFIGAKSVKWLTKIVIWKKESMSYHQQEEFTLFNPIDKPLAARSKNEKLLSLLYPNLNAVITNVQNYDTFKYWEPLTLWGYAFTGWGNPVKRVEITLDGGQ